MPIAVYTLSQIEDQLRSFFAARFPNRDLGSESWLGKQWRALSMALLLVQKAVADADKDGTPSQDSSTAALDQFAYVFGVPKNTGGYGRDAATAASDGAGLVSGTNGTVFGDGLVLLASDGVTQVKTSGSVTVPGSPPGSGSVEASFVAVTTGTAGNLAVGSVLTFVSPPSGGSSTVTLTSALSGAVDKETDAQLLERVLLRLQQPPKGGAASDYKTWAEAGSTAVYRAHVYPHRGGLGTVEVAVVSAGSGTARVPSSAVKTAVDSYVATVRPVTVEGYKTLLPYTAPTGMSIVARLKPSLTKYNFDWDDTAATYTVDLYTAGSPSTLRLNTLAPQSLKDAIDLVGGTDPRIVVAATAGPVVPVQVKATAWSDAGGKTTLTLENPLPTGFLAPAVGNNVTAGGPTFAQTANAVLAYVDSLGPSRVGFESVLTDLWEDTCAVARITEICLGQKDTDGTRFFTNVAATNGITINGLTGDVTGAADNAGSPELLYAKSVVVKQ